MPVGVESLLVLGSQGIRAISTPDSDVAVLIVPTNEELEIARQTVEEEANWQFLQ